MSENPRKQAIYAGDWSQCAGKPYRPSNGTEGAIFMGMWCGHCERDRAFREDTGDSCPIAADAMVFDVEDEAYPRQWRYDDNGVPECTGFVEEQSGEIPE